MTNTSISVAGNLIDIGCRVILWNEPEGLSLYKSGIYSERNLDIEQLRKEINCFVVHHSVTWRAKGTHSGLIGRKLSVTFSIDDDNHDGIATIYQHLDVEDVGYSHKPLNYNGPGVEIAYMPQAWENPNLYSEANQKKYNVQPHKIVEDVVHGKKLKVFAPTDAQVKALTALLYGFAKAFPDISPEFPRDSNGNIIKTVVKNPKGFLNHYNVTNQKIDALGLPLEEIETNVKALLVQDKETPHNEDNIVGNVTKPTLNIFGNLLSRALIKFRGKQHC